MWKWQWLVSGDVPVQDLRLYSVKYTFQKSVNISLSKHISLRWTSWSFILQGLLWASSNKALFIYSVTCIRAADGHFTCLLKNNYPLRNICNIFNGHNFYVPTTGKICCVQITRMFWVTRLQDIITCLLFSLQHCSLSSGCHQIINLQLRKRNH